MSRISHMASIRTNCKSMSSNSVKSPDSRYPEARQYIYNQSNKMKGYAFIEFDSIEIAEIVANVLNQYTMFGKILQAKVLKESELKFNIFKGWNRKRVFMNGPKKFITKNNSPKTPKERAEKVAKLLASEEKKRALLTSKGIMYDFPGYVCI
jgi:nucleolar protein 15